MTLSGRGDAPSLAMMYCDSIAFRIFDFNIVEQFSGNSCMGTWMSEKAANYYNVSKDNPKWEAPGFGGITDTVSGTIMDTPSTHVLNMDFNGLPLINVVARESLTWGGYVVDVEPPVRGNTNLPRHRRESRSSNRECCFPSAVCNEHQGPPGPFPDE